MVERDLDAEAAAQGIHRIPVPTPFAVGPVNCYLIDDDPLTLLDAGPNSGTALDALARGVETAGRRLEDVQRVVLSHQHIDHLGLAGLVARRSGATVVVLDRLRPFVENYEDEAAADDDFASDVMRANGIGDDVVTVLQSVSRAFRGWGAPSEVHDTVADGSRLDFAGRSLQVFHRPGHSPTDTVFYDERTRTLLAADHLLPHISSNPLLTRPLGGGTERPRALEIYIDSMRATRAMDVDLVLPGHGDPFIGHADLIDQRFGLHERRAEKLHGLLTERSRTAHELAQALWGNIAVTQAFLTLSEVLGHLDLLEREGRVAVSASEDGFDRYVATR